MSWMSERPTAPPLGCMWNWRYSRNQNAIFALLTKVRRSHHQARGFDRARHSNLMLAPLVIELTCKRHNSVTERDRSRDLYATRIVASRLGDTRHLISEFEHNGVC